MKVFSIEKTKFLHKQKLKASSKAIMVCAFLAAALWLLLSFPINVKAPAAVCDQIFINQTTIADLGEATVYMTLHNPTNKDLTIDNLDKFNVTTMLAQGKPITKIEYFYWGSTIKQNCTSTIMNPNSTVQCGEQTPVQCYQTTSCSNYTEMDWVKFNEPGLPPLVFPSNSDMPFKIVMHHDIALGNQRFDWIPQILTDSGICRQDTWAWANSSWNYRQNYSFVNYQGYNIELYRAYAEMDTATLISNGKMFANCSDLRAGNDTMMYQMFFENCNTATTRVYAQLPYAMNGTNNYYVYYGGMALGDTRNISIMNATVINLTTTDKWYGAAAGFPVDGNPTLVECGGYNTNYRSACSYINFSNWVAANFSQTISETVAELGGDSYWTWTQNSSLYRVGGMMPGTNCGPSVNCWSSMIDRINFTGNNLLISRVINITTARRNAGVAEFYDGSNQVIIVGGDNSATVSSTEMYYPNSNTKATYTGTYSMGRNTCDAFSANGTNQAYCAGGTGPSNNIRVFYPTTQTSVDYNLDLTTAVQGANSEGWDVLGNQLMYVFNGRAASAPLFPQNITEINITANTITLTNMTMWMGGYVSSCTKLDKSVYCFNVLPDAQTLNTQRWEMRIPSTKTGSEESGIISWSSNMTNSTIAGEDILHSVFWSSTAGLSGYIFSFNNGSNWTDGSCGTFPAQPACEQVGCSWASAYCGGSAAACTNWPNSTYCGYDAGCSWGGHTCGGTATACTSWPNSTYCGYDAGCAWNAGTSSKHTYNYSIGWSTTSTFADYKTGLTAGQPTTYAVALGAMTNQSTTCYQNLDPSDNNRCTTVATSSSDDDIAMRFNFTIAESEATIYYIYTEVEYSASGTISGAEDCSVEMVNFAGQSLDAIGADATTEVTRQTNTTANMGDYIDDQNHNLVIVVTGNNLDGSSSDACNVDMINVTIGYTNPGSCTGTHDPCSTYSESQTNCQRVNCDWTADSCSGTPDGCGTYNASQTNCERVLCTWNGALCSGTPNYEFKNDSWTAFTGTSNYSNVTKSVNITVGSNIKWKVYANNTAGLWNMTSTFDYNTTEAACDASHCTSCLTEGDCTTATCYWWSASCHATEQQLTCWIEDTVNRRIWLPAGCQYVGSGQDVVGA